MLAAVLLAGCTTTASPGRLPGRVDWPAYAATVYALPAGELESRYLAAVREHDAAPTAAAKIRLALLMTAPRSGRMDTSRAAALLAMAHGDPAATANETEFAGFLQTLVTQLAEQQTALATETQRRQALEQQIDALKALETRLNSDETSR